MAGKWDHNPGALLLARVFSCAVNGLDRVMAAAEAGMGWGADSRGKVISVVKNAGFYYPRCKVIVNLAPASVHKEDPAYDQPIALGMLITTNQLDPVTLHKKS